MRWQAGAGGALLVLALVAALAACGERGPGAAPPVEQEDGETEVWHADDTPEATPAELQVFQREAVPDGDGRLMVHALIPDGATQEEVRVGMHQLLRAEAEADPTLVAVRLIAYGARARSEAEAELVPVAWGELVPPGGWDEARPGAAVPFQRIFTYFGAGPDW
jgi:predicted small lipoprotein YifL